jgi:septal ring factor EnvC (AmiA/AmiB activator)
MDWRTPPVKGEDKMKIRLAVLAGAVLMALASPVTFADRGGSISERVQHMERRIDQGIRSGSLTRNEAQRLRDELRGILHKERRMRDDGRLSGRERDVLHADLDRLDRHISREKHDDDRRGDRRHDRRY